MKTASGHALRTCLLLVAVGCSGCAAAADLGMRAAFGLVEAALKPTPGSSSEASEASESARPIPAVNSGETPCRRKQAEWRRAEGNPRTEPPLHLRCGPAGEWPDESEVRTASLPPTL